MLTSLSTLPRLQALPILGRLWRRYRLPGIALHPSARLWGGGQLTYGDGVRIAEFAKLIVPPAAQLCIGNDCYIGRHVELGPGGTIRIGDHSSLQDRCILVGDVSVGRYSMLSLNVLITSGRHTFDAIPHRLIRDQDADRGGLSAPVEIHEDCWLGVNSVIMPGVTVGRGCVVGANSVVTSDLPPYSVAVGAPAKVVKKRLDFLPPPRIDWTIEADFPYFYSGFELSCDERKSNLNLVGHVARSSFSIWLGSMTGELHVRLRSLQAVGGLIGVGGARFEVSPDWSVLVFPQGATPVQFEAMSGGGFAVSGAWIQ